MIYCTSQLYLDELSKLLYVNKYRTSINIFEYIFIGIKLHIPSRQPYEDLFLKGKKI